MNSPGAFCPRCGDPVERPTTAAPHQPRDPDAALCDGCYLEEFDLVDAPDRLEISVCATCGAVHRGNRWVDVEARDYTDVAVEAVHDALGVHVAAGDVSWGVEPTQVDVNTIEMHCQFTGVVRGRRLESTVTVPVYISRETCTRCGRIAGDYYAGVVQVRAAEREPSEREVDRAVEIAQRYVADREADGDRDAFLTEVIRRPSGVDLKVSATKLAQGIASRIRGELGGTVTDSQTLVTEDEDGQEVYRVTYAVRLPPYPPGVVLDVDDEGPVLVTSASGNLKGLRLTTGERYEANHTEGLAPEARRLGSTADGQSTPVVAVEDDRAVQVLDPETYETVTVPRPDYFDPTAEEVPVLKSRAGIHILPADRV